MEYKTSIGVVLGVVVAVAIALLALGMVLFGGNSGQTPVGGERAGLQEFNDGIKAGDLASKFVSKKLEPLQNSAKLYCNTTGKDLMLEYGEVVITTGETASTTYLGSIFATTSTSIAAAQDYLAPAFSKQMLLSTKIATSTTASTTNSIMSNRIGQGVGSVLVANNACVFGYLQNVEASGPACSGGLCETATSSNRGFNPIFNIRIRNTVNWKGITL